MMKQWRATTEHLCVNNKIGTGSGKEPQMVPVPTILIAVKSDEGAVDYFYTPACKNYKFNKQTKHYRCETAIGEGDSPCQLVALLNGALKREGILHGPQENR
jgi:hypothetical protein